MIRFSVALQTDVGRVREHNEDACAIDEVRGLFVLADGMGGHAAGEVASRLAVKTVLERFSRVVIGSEREAVVVLRTVVQVAHDQIHKWSIGPRRGMGTTLVIGLVYGRRLYVANVGDSRAYLQRGERLVPLTRDQNGMNEALDKNYFPSKEALLAAFGENRSLLTCLAQYMGAEHPPVPVITVVDLKRGDRLLKCSDGLTNTCSEELIDSLLRGASDPAIACTKLIAAANVRGGQDNITTIVAFFDDPAFPDPTEADVAGLQYEVYVPPTAEPVA